MAARVVLGVQYGNESRGGRGARPWRGTTRSETQLRHRPFDTAAIEEEFGDQLREAFESNEVNHDLMVTPVDAEDADTSSMQSQVDAPMWRASTASSRLNSSAPSGPLGRAAHEGPLGEEDPGPGCLIHPASHAKVAWDLVVIAMVCFSVIEMPFRIGFSVETSVPILVSDVIFDICFVLDIILTFFTGYYNECEAYVFTRREIAIRYLKGFFVIDVVSVLPVDYFVYAMRANKQKDGNSAFRLLRLLRLAKLARLGRLRKLTELLEQHLQYHTVAMLKVMGKVIFLIHMLTCFCYWMSPPCPYGTSEPCPAGSKDEDRAFGSSWVRMFHIDQLDLGSRYLASFHLITATLMAVGYGDLYPASTLERLFSICVQLTGAIIFGFILSGVTMVIESSNPRSVERKKRMAEIKEWLRSRNLPLELRMGVWSHFQYLMRQRSIFKDEPEILRHMPTTLRNSIVEQICLQYVQKLQRIFGQEDRSLIAELSVLLQPLQVANGECVVEAGEPPTDFFTVNTGTIEALMDEEGLADIEELLQAGKRTIPGLDRHMAPPPAAHRMTADNEALKSPGRYSQIGSATTRRPCRRDADGGPPPGKRPSFDFLKPTSAPDTETESQLVLCGVYQEAETLSDFPVSPVRLQGGDRRSELLALSKDLLHSALMQFPGACERFTAKQRDTQVQLWEACISCELARKRSPVHGTKARRMKSKILIKGTACEVARLNPEVFSYMRLDELRFEQIFATRMVDATGCRCDGNETERDVLNRYVIPPHHSKKVRWDVFVGVLVMYSILLIPFRFGFNDTPCTFSEVVDVVVDLLFFVDICLSFRTGFLDSEGGVNTIPADIRDKYLRGWFSIDLASTVPLDRIVVLVSPDAGRGATAARLLRFARLARMLKMVRVLKMGRLAEIAESSVDVSTSLVRLVGMCTKIFMPAHILACFWHYLTHEGPGGHRPCESGHLQCGDADLPAPSHWVEAQVDKYESDLSASSFTDADGVFNSYVISIYWVFTTMTTVGYGDVVPTNNLERVFAVCVMIFGATVFGYIIGTVAEMSNEHNRDVLGLQMTALRHYGSEHRLPERTQKLLRFHYDFWYHEMSPQHYEAGLLSKLPPSLRKEVIQYIHRNVISSIALFKKKLPGWFVAASVRLLEPQAFCMGEIVIGVDQAGPQQDIFFIHEGTCEAYWRPLVGIGEIGPQNTARRRSLQKATSQCRCGHGCEEGCQGRLLDVYPPGTAFGYEFVLQQCYAPFLEHKETLVRCSDSGPCFLYALRHGVLVHVSRQYPDFGQMIQQVLGDTILREGKRWHKARKRRDVWLEDYNKSAPWLQEQEPAPTRQRMVHEASSGNSQPCGRNFQGQESQASQGLSGHTDLTPPGFVPHAADVSIHPA